jgi:archaellum component FlaC
MPCNALLTMKKLIAALSVLCFLLISAPCLTAFAQPLRLPHENPDYITDTLDTIGILLSYARINNLASQSQFQTAQDFLTALNNTDLPSDIQYIISQYNTLYQQLFTTLNNVESLLNQASDLLNREQLDEAIQLVDAAGTNIKDNEYLLKDIEAATDSIISKLGALKGTTSTQITEAHTRLADSIARLKTQVETYGNLRQVLTEKYNQLTQLTRTELSLQITPLTAYVGDDVTVSGRLQSEDMPLPGKILYFMVNNTYRLTSVTTDSNGSYSAVIRVPYEYADKMLLTAVYEPLENDARNYLAAYSQTLAITTLFYHTRLKIDMSGRMYPEQPFAINGEIVTDNASISRKVSVSLDNALFAEETVTSPFQLEITPSANITPGNKALLIAVTPSGRYSGASQKSTVIVSVMPVYIQADIPPVVLSPQTLKVSGILTTESGPAADTTVNLKLGNAITTATTASDGSFQGLIELNLLPSSLSFFDWFPVSSHQIEITTAKHDPLININHKQLKIFIINPLTSGLILAVLIALGFFIRKISRRKVSPEKEMPPADERKEIPKAGVKKAPVVPVITSPAFKPRLGVIAAKVVSAYRNVLTTIEKLTGTIMPPHLTLREFLQVTRLPSSTVAERFVELTAITENALYSTREPPEDAVARAEKLATAIKEELLHGTP